MTIHAAPAAFALEAFLAAHRTKDVLRFIACGSVDDGKSTLIGRLLHDTKQVFEDQLAALARDSRRRGTQGGGLDFALLTDGLAAEREQGITIDVAYRFFSTPQRNFIVADAPGHEQYTRNMATGASLADVGVLLVDARKGLGRQTRRHSLLLSLIGVPRVLLAVNKMDLVGWSRDAYEAIVAEYRAFAVGLGFEDVAAIPLSALSGDNVVHPAVAAPWYEGPTLVRHLETVPVGERDPEASFRMPVQWVNRPSLDFRGYAGLVAGGSVAVGERVKVLPSGRESTVARIVTHDGDLPRALPGQSVTLVLADDIDVSRGDVIAAAASPPAVSQRLEARLFWAAEHPLAPGASVQVKLGAASAIALVEAVHYRIDPDAAAPEETDALLANDIGDVTLALDRPVAFDAYRGNRDTGSLILIDRETADTVGLGLVLAPTLREGGRSRSTGDRSASGRGVVARLLAKAGLSRPS